MQTKRNNTNLFGRFYLQLYAEDSSLFGPVEIEQIHEGEDQKAYKKRCEDDNAKIRKG